MTKFLYIALIFSLALLPSQLHSQQYIPEDEMTDDERETKRKAKIKFSLDNLNSEHGKSVERATYFFELMGEEAVSYLLKKLRDKDITQRAKINTIYTMGRLRENAERAVPILIPYLKDEHPDVRAVTAKALGRIKTKNNAAVGGLIHLMFDDDEWVRKCAIFSLNRISTPRAKEALREYRDLQKKKLDKSLTHNLSNIDKETAPHKKQGAASQ